MSSDEYSPEVVGIVRRFSAQVGESMSGNVLAQAVASEEAENRDNEQRGDRWREWLRFESVACDPDVADLQAKAREAADLWRKLKLDAGSLDGDDPPTIGSLWETVHIAQKEWDTRKEKGFGKAKSQCFSFLETMDAHKYLFSVIPNGDKYTSLLTGVVTSVVKASVNHEQTADGFSRALQEINKDLNFVRRGTQICNTPELKRHVISLYCEVFSFLCYAMKWYSSSWNRFRKSFDVKFYDKNVEERIDGIQRLVRRVHDEMQLTTDKTVQSIHQEQRVGFMETNTRLATLFDELGRELDIKLDVKLEQFSKRIGERMRLTLMANAQHELAYQEPRKMWVEDNHLASERNISGAASRPLKLRLEGFLSSIAIYAGDSKEDDTHASTYTTDRPLIPGEVIDDVQRWIESKDSRLLWVEGPAYGPFDDALRSIGSHICSVAEEVKIPCISFLAKADRTSPGINKSTSPIALLYSIILQVVRNVPLIKDSDDALVEEQFNKLDGTRQSLRVALDVLKALLAMATPGLILVICGFELIDSGDDVELLVDLIDLFGSQPAERRAKVLFVTKGNCRSLNRATGVRQRSDATRMVLARGGSPLPGGQSAQDISRRYL